MNAAGRTPLRILTVAFAASALLVVLQTVVFRSLPYDSSAVGTVSVALRVGFLLADALTLIGLLALRPRLGPGSALGLLGALLVLGGVISGAVGLAVSAIGSRAQTLASLGKPLGSAEPMWSLGVALLAALGIASVSPLPFRAHARGLVTAIGMLVALAVAFRIGQLGVPGPRSLAMAWTSWALEVVRPALVALLAIVAGRGAGKGHATKAAPEGPYRAAGEGPPAVSDAAAGPVATAAFGQASRALAFYQVTFAVRLAAAIVSPIAALIFSSYVRGSFFAQFWLLLVVGAGANGLGAIAAFRLLALPRAAEARGPVIGAALAMGLAMLLEVFTSLYALYGWIAGARYTGEQNVVFGLSVGWPIAVLLGGVSLILVASALVRVGELVVSDRVTSRAFRSQALTVFAGALQTGAVLAVIDATSGRYTSSAAPGAILLFAMVLVTVGVTIATVVVHLVAVSAARAHLRLSMQPSASLSAGL